MLRSGPTLVWLIVLAFIGSLGCEPTATDNDALSGQDVPPQTRSLVDNTLWTLVPMASDPWATSRDDDTKPCEELDVGVETLPDGIWFDIITKNCNYATVSQPLLIDVPAGSELTVRIWHFAITTTSGTYTLAFQVGEQNNLLWSSTKDVPTDSGLIYATFRTEKALNAGATLYYHISNHGDNSWSLVELSATY